MPLSMQQASVSAFRQMLEALSAILDKAAAHAAARKIEPAVLIQDRLYPDMFSLGRQVQAACDFSARACARLAGLDPPTIETGDATFEDLKTRVAKTLAFLGGLPATALEAGADREITFPIGDRKVTMTGAAYLTRFALPHFYFHLTTAYAILRHDGVEIGKRDYMGQWEG